MRPLIKLKACRISVFVLAFLEKNAKTFFSLQLNKHYAIALPYCKCK